MNLEQFFKKHPSIVKRDFARELDVQNTDLAYWSFPESHEKFRKVPAKVALRIEQLTKGEVTRADIVLDWRAIWPDFDPLNSPYTPLSADASMARKIAHASALTGLSALSASLACLFYGWQCHTVTAPVARRLARN